MSIMFNSCTGVAKSSHFKAAIFTALSAVALATGAGAATVSANNPALVSLGSFAAGSYVITATGLVDLTGPVNSAFTVGPDGVPTMPVTSPGYGYCNPSGCDFDVFSSAYGTAGMGINLGALAGTLTATPTAADWFLIGFGKTVTLAAPGQIYALVNDTFYPNNQGSFDVMVDRVPEPASWAMLIAGFGLTGAALRQRRASEMRRRRHAPA